jgi:hypothetical protein
MGARLGIGVCHTTQQSNSAGQFLQQRPSRRPYVMMTMALGLMTICPDAFTTLFVPDVAVLPAPTIFPCAPDPVAVALCSPSAAVVADFETVVVI